MVFNVKNFAHFLFCNGMQTQGMFVNSHKERRDGTRMSSLKWNQGEFKLHKSREKIAMKIKTKLVHRWITSQHRFMKHITTQTWKESSFSSLKCDKVWLILICCGYFQFSKKNVMGMIDCFITKKNKPSFKKSQNRYITFFQDISKGQKVFNFD